VLALQFGKVAAVINLQSRGMRRGALIVFVLTMLPTLWFGLRTYGSFQLLRSAYEAVAPNATQSLGANSTQDHICPGSLLINLKANT
jgi:hypothetical protein